MGRRSRRFKRRLPAALLSAVALLPLAGCSAVPAGIGSGAAAPAVTGAIPSPPVAPDAALPPTLSFADAGAIRQAAAQSFASLSPAAPQSWTNEETGSSGTLVAVSAVRENGGAPCRSYDATVESLRGVHRYAATACREADGRLVLRAVSG